MSCSPVFYNNRSGGLVLISANQVKVWAGRRRTEPIRGRDGRVSPALGTNVGVRESAFSCVLFTNVGEEFCASIVINYTKQVNVFFILHGSS